MRIENEILLDFSDVLICPKRSESPSRKNVSLTRTFRFLNSGATWTGVPIVASNMATTGTFSMSKALSKHGMSTCLHKYYSISELVEFFRENEAFYTLGIKDDDFEKLDAFTKAFGSSPKQICLDVANGYTKFFVEKCQIIREKYKNATIMAGNICTPEMVQELLLIGGVDIVKVGIGGGSACTTRIVTGVGIPQFSAIADCADAAHGLRGHVVSDGGCTTSGDISKAFGAGSDFVMLGGMLSGHEECESEWECDVQGNKKFMRFYGMSSKEAMDKFNGGQCNYRASEGRSVKVPYKGLVDDTLLEIMGGIRSSCTYVGTETLKDFSKCCTFVRVNNTHNRIFEKN
jgi:GMP reductase